jgi:hypothetical protein
MSVPPPSCVPISTSTRSASSGVCRTAAPPSNCRCIHPPTRTPDAITRELRRGNTDGTALRARASTRGYPSSPDSLLLPGFRARGFPALPAVPARDLDGKEGVDGSSPSEGFDEMPANRHFLVACPRNTRVQRGLHLWYARRFAITRGRLRTRFIRTSSMRATKKPLQTDVIRCLAGRDSDPLPPGRDSAGGGTPEKRSKALG